MLRRFFVFLNLELPTKIMGLGTSLEIAPYKSIGDNSTAIRSPFYSDPSNYSHRDSLREVEFHPQILANITSQIFIIHYKIFLIQIE